MVRLNALLLINLLAACSLFVVNVHSITVSSHTSSYFIGIASWVDYSTRTLNLNVTASTSGWIAVGISEGPSVISDYYQGRVTWNSGNAVADGQDCYVPVNGDYNILIRDTVQNWAVSSGWENVTEAVTGFRLVRAIDTGDRQHDLIVKDKTVNMMWAIGNSDDFNSPPEYTGYFQINFAVREGDPTTSTTTGRSVETSTNGGNGVASIATSITLFSLCSVFFKQANL